MSDNPYLQDVLLKDDLSPGPAPFEKERQAAIQSLLSHGRFAPLNDDHPPYTLGIERVENRLVLTVRNAEGHDLPALILSLSPYRSIIRDYFMIIDSYETARREGNETRLQPIDMARRGLHNEGAALLMERLADKIDLDLPAARALFTLICALHREQLRLIL